jgi:glycosyltransferase involved in cell wall biosynthesis
VTIVALLAAYNEADVIEQVISDLIAQGLSVYLIDHGSTDGTADLARPWLGRGLLAIERFPEESGFPAELARAFAWEALLERKEQLAHMLDGDWFLHSDADELRESPFPELTLGQAIAEVDRLGYNAIDFAVLNFAPTDDDFARGGDLRAHFRYYEPALVFDRLQIKCWKKGEAPVDLRASGGHEARFAGRRVFPIRFLDRHYPVRTQAQGERKVFAERKPRFVAAERARGWHVQYDAIVEGHRFIRDAAELRLYDATEARRALFEAHRGAEASEARAAGLDEELRQRRYDLKVRERQVDEWQAATQKARRVAADAQEEAESARRAAESARRDLLRSEDDREALRRALGEADAAWQRERARLTTELDRARGEEDRLRERVRAGARELEQRAVDLAELRRALEQQLRDGDRLRQTLERAQADAADTRGRLDAFAGALRGAEVRIDEIYASRTWRWTAPGRLLWRLLRR